MQPRTALEGFRITPIETSKRPTKIEFSYAHPLAEPSFTRDFVLHDSPELEVNKLLQYGMLESDPIVSATMAVFDPQNRNDCRFFRSNGSTAALLAHVLNYREAYALTGGQEKDPEKLIALSASMSQSDVVVLKMGPRGALVWENGKTTHIPAFKTASVWPIGSGDTFAASFATFWMEQGKSATAAAKLASLATAYYCSTGGFATRQKLGQLQYEEITISENFTSGHHPSVYLAGPFFNLGQLWLIDQARINLLEVGFDVCSPYHDIGKGSADEVVQEDLDAIKRCELVFAIVDGLDAGTIYEIGYARALNKKVIIYSELENDQDLKMMVGSDCTIIKDYTTAIYEALWQAACV
jgi:nucleoside 2-deoxyribosyltransferase